ncbi:MAG TPA: DUF3572 domain-containing protein [Xanthobacteraceae bacterium]|nr:DUF3572 domain-containing protein [Xanthobacteraceae bacterium]
MGPFKQSQMSTEMAELLAVRALSFIAEDAGRLGHFLAATGLGPTQIREASRQPSFLAGVLEYVETDEALLLALAEYSHVDPAAFVQARAALVTIRGAS